MKRLIFCLLTAALALPAMAMHAQPGRLNPVPLVERGARVRVSVPRLNNMREIGNSW